MAENEAAQYLLNGGGGLPYLADNALLESSDSKMRKSKSADLAPL